MNKMFIVGNLVKDPETRATANGESFCTFTVAVNRRSEKEQTDYFLVKAWKKLGENCKRFLSKGRKVTVVGELQARLYQDKAGNTRMSLDVRADDVEFLPGNRAAEPEKAPEDDFDAYQDVQVSDIPF